MLRPWLPLAALVILAAPLAWFWLGMSQAPGPHVTLGEPVAGDVPTRDPGSAPSGDETPRAETLAQAPDLPLDIPRIDRRAALLAWEPERLPEERLVLPDDDEPVLRLEEQVLGCDGPPVLRIVTVDRAGRIVESTYLDLGDPVPAQRSERALDPRSLLPLLSSLNEAGFFALELESDGQAAKEALLPAGTTPDDDPERRLSRLSVRLAGGSFTASGTNVAGRVRRLPEFAELRAFELALERVGSALAR